MNPQEILAAAEEAARKAIREKAAKWQAEFGSTERDCCGFAWVMIENARDPVAKAAALADHGQPGHGYKHHRKGFVIYMPGRAAYNGQSLSIFEAGAQACAAVLSANGVKCWEESRMD